MNGPVAAYLGIDLGTSGLKLSLIGEHGSIVAESEAPCGVHAPEPGYAECDPLDWAAGLETAAAHLASRLTSSFAEFALRAIGVTGQMHGLVLTDDSGKPVRPAILWPDQRTAECLDAWVGMDAGVRGRLSNPIVAGMPGPMLSWLSEFEPESLRAASHVTFPKDWLRGCLTGDRATERSDASATLLWDAVADQWSPEAMHVAGLPREKLPTLMPSDSKVGVVGEGVAARSFERFGWGGVPVVTGGSDVACALHALRHTPIAHAREETLVVNVGTGIQILRPDAVSEARVGALTHLYADADGGWYEMVAIQNGGSALTWVQQLLRLDWNDFVTAAQSARTGSGGAIFSPFLIGERGLVAAADARGGWSGLTPAMGRAELARSAFEALAFTIRRGVDALDPSAGSVVLTGGGARDPWVRQLISDALGRPLTYAPLRSASAVGAALLAARGVGASLVVPSNVTHASPSSNPSLDELYARWTLAVHQ